MKRILMLLIFTILLGMAAATAVRADCDTPVPTDPTSFE
jgi:hypothetical protein